MDANRKPVTRSWFVAQIRSTLADIGLPQHQYDAGHSFRIRRSSNISSAQDPTIQILGRWHSAAQCCIPPVYPDAKGAASYGIRHPSISRCQELGSPTSRYYPPYGNIISPACMSVSYPYRFSSTPSPLLQSWGLSAALDAQEGGGMTHSSAGRQILSTMPGLP